ncbi:NAD-dependent epimerase/dehydratase family protein [Dolichospermum flos-aquae UHCC 0037]|uniref:NAD-dependent epimerase/dehydratase family protein n=1 Tax=Dolichospermum flos-aquae UHCC 0037 TaxID=2590026 RepID=A0ACC7S971_DOLFA|nr:NAD-dependent epimerase/dehydratase family protein [Anabaena sp. 54]MTJ44741.1 NAD-dependent epimerase/dehydratase family protein [Dolichospermum flos-aquae UHCC 0037]
MIMRETYQGKKVLITGGLGFIGSTLAIKLVEWGADVTLVDSMIPEYGGNLFNIEPIKNQVRVNFSDVRDPHSMEYLVKEQDYLFNLAGQVSHIDSMTDPLTDLDINTRAQVVILEACRKFNPRIVVIFASTRQIYGKPQYLPVDERHPLYPTDVNGINNMAGEWHHTLYHNVHDLNTVSLRLTNTYGPRQLLKHNRQGFIGVFVRQIIQGEKIKIFGDGQQIRDMNYVDDVVDALVMAGAKPECYGQVYNLGGNEPINLLNLVKLLIDLNGDGAFEIIPFPPEKKRIDIGDYYGDYRKFSQMTNWQPQTSLKEGYTKMIDYYKEHLEKYLN